MKPRFLILISMLACLSGQTRFFVLCEGNFGTPNASLWEFPATLETIQGPLVWDANTNPLGDTGQSLTVHNDRLYIVLNNSHTVRIVSLENGFQPEANLAVPGASPRNLAISDGRGYLTCWYLSGILVFDIHSLEILDTLHLGGWPEDILSHENKLYVSLTMNPGYTAGNQVLEIDIQTGTPQVSDSFQVVAGPGELVLQGSALYVASKYYDAGYNAFAGTARIDLVTGTVTRRDHGPSSEYSDDIMLLNGKVYRIWQGGICPLDDSLDLDLSGRIGNLSGVYAAAVFGDTILFGCTDYVAPDQVVVMDTAGVTLAAYQVGAIPGDFARYQPGALSIAGPRDHPRDFALMNYPNPFNPRTTLTLPGFKHGPAELVIYTLTGRELRRWKLKGSESGTHTVTWDAGAMPAGVYVAVLRSSGTSLTRKMTLLK